MKARLRQLIFFVTLTGSINTLGSPVSQGCPDLSGQWTCKACNEDRGPFQTGYTISQKSAGGFTDYEFPGYPEPVRYTTHGRRTLEFGSARVSCREGRGFVIEMRNGTQKTTTQLMERLGSDRFVVETKEEGVNQFGNTYEKVRLEVCAPAKPEASCPTCPLIPPTPQARGDECALLRAEVSQLRSQASTTETKEKSK